MKAKIKIDIVSDIVCPWCYIGQSRMKTALSQLTDIEASISWKPYQLHPEMEVGGQERRVFMEQKFGDDAAALTDRVTENAKQEGLPIDFEAVSMIPNTVQAHRLMWFAHKEGKDNELARILFEAYFAEGKDVEDKGSLTSMGTQAGLSADALQKFQQTNEGEDEVLYEERNYRVSGITAVPSFIINDKYLIKGAQPPEILIETLQKIAGETANA